MNDTLWCPHATVATIICDQGRYLMVEEVVNGQQVLNQPAGHIDAGETIFQAACRETLEETGWEVELTAFLGIYVLRFPNSDEAYHRYAFLARPVRLTDRPLDEGILRAPWLSFDEIVQGDYTLRSHLVRQCLDDHRRGRSFPLDLIFETQ
ncbi:MAG: NUDIX hydrolase [Hahellaceae bacterium]|nr:NUDIX hydrolase [Hahellaceae bacterium]